MTSQQETRVSAPIIGKAWIGIAGIVALAGAGCADIDPDGPFAPANPATLVAAEPTVAGFTTASGTVSQTGVLSEAVRPAGSNTIIELAITGIISGTLTGTVEDRFRLEIHPNGTFTAQGTSLCTCSIDGRSGVVELGLTDTGSVVEGVPHFAGRWVIRDATGELAGLQGVLQVEGAVNVLTNLSVTDYSGWIRFHP